MTIGQKIKKLRKQLNMSVDDLAAKLGKNRATVYRYEKGDIENLPLDVLGPLAKALETTPGYLMGWEEEKKISNPKEATVGDIIRTLRLQNKLSLQEFSNELGIPIDKLDRYETGTEQIPVNIINAIAEHFGVSISELMGVSIVEGTTQSLYITRDESSVGRFERWNQEFGHNVFTDEELEKLAEYARFLLASRKK